MFTFSEIVNILNPVEKNVAAADSQICELLFDSRRLTVGAIEQAMEDAFPMFSVRRGFTSQIIIDHVLRRDGEVIDNVTEALDRDVANGVKNLVVQPTHLMNGLEYADVVDEIAAVKVDRRDKPVDDVVILGIDVKEWAE